MKSAINTQERLDWTPSEPGQSPISGPERNRTANLELRAVKVGESPRMSSVSPAAQIKISVRKERPDPDLEEMPRKAYPCGKS